MFKQLFSFELKLWFKRPGVYIFFMVIFLLSMLVTMLASGLFGNSIGDSNTTINSARAISLFLSSVDSGFIALIILVSIIAPVVYKDFQYNTHPLLFTKPITKFGYMIGRFSAVFLVALFVLSGSAFGHMFVCALPGVDPSRLGPFSIMNYVKPFLFFVIPNTLLVGAIFFSLVTFTRNMIAGYVGCLVFVIVKAIATALLGNLENQHLAALLEPFGEQAFRQISKYWSPEEQNTLSVPFEGLILYNRMIWLGISMLIAAFTYIRFQFSQFNEPVSFFKRKNKKELLSLSSAPILALSDIIKPTQVFSTKFSWYQTWFIAKFEFKKITRSIFFLIIILLAILSLLISIPVSGNIYGTPTLPVTYNILGVGAGLFKFFMYILIIFYAGVLVWRDRDAKVDELMGASPVKQYVGFMSKLIALILVQAVLFLVIMLTGIGAQLYYGYYNVEILHYIKDLYGFQLISLTLVCVLNLALQTIINNRYVAYTVSVLIFLALPILFSVMEWSNQLIEFNSDGPELHYSDMNKYGHIIFPFIIYKVYWSSFSVILIVTSVLMWARGKEKGFRSRLRIAGSLFNAKAKLALSLAIIIFIISGGFIYYNTSILNKNYSSKQEERIQADFEKKYRHYLNTQQPRIVAANWNVDIYPKQRSAKIKGYYIIKNKSRRNVDSVILNMSHTARVDFKFEKAATAVITDKKNGIYIYKLAVPLKPGDSMKLNITMDYYPKGFKASDAGRAIVDNGTFFSSDFLPSLGYNPAEELDENSTRKKYGLPPKERMANVNDSLARMNNYISRDADWIDFECTLSTSSDQTAIAPGYLLKQWQQDGRNYFHYKMDCKILNFYSFLSARYEIKHDSWTDPASGKVIAIDIYYNKGHEYNLDRMVRGVKKSLAYYSKNFSPYQHRQVRIVEFSVIDGTFAQSFPNTIPFSESIGFIAKVNDKDPESIDYPFYVTAHEVAHQWWAHQVIGGNVQGSTLMSETMSQYSALMVMEKEFGKPAMKKFLKYEMNSYLRGRATETKKELPLMLGENQQYIHYNKGSVIMYALRDYIGEDSLNAALAKYIRKVAYQEPPYTNSVEFVNYLRAATPDSLKYIINDMFETITIYENKTTACSYTKTKDGKYLVKFSVECMKFKSDSIGRMKSVPVADWIDIGVFGSKEVNGKKTETELYLQKRKIDKNKMEFEITVDEEPVKVGIDPYNKLIDRTPDNNTKSLNGGDHESADGGGTTVSVKVGG